MFFKCLLVASLAVGSQAERVSPVQKVLSLIADMRGKVLGDLAEEGKGFTEYAGFCDKEASEKGYAIKTATREVADLTATIQDGVATIEDLESQIASLSTELAGKDREQYAASQLRKEDKEVFVASEKELFETADKLSSAVAEAKKATSFTQGKGTASVNKHLKEVVEALSTITNAAWVSEGSAAKLKSLLQGQNKAGEENDLNLAADLRQRRQAPAAGAADDAAPSGGGIVQTLEDLKGKAEESLSDLRQKESKDAHNYQLMSQGLTNEINIMQEKLGDSKSSKEQTGEQNGLAQGELGAAQKSKAADEEYVATLKHECQETAQKWEERNRQAKDEVAAMDKATEILTQGVKALVQLSVEKTLSVSRTPESSDLDADLDAPVPDAKAAMRKALVQKLKDLGKKYHSYAMMQMVSAASSDPFQKIRGLIEDMIMKLNTEVAEEATQKGFCDEELGKSEKSEQDKQMTIDKLTSRIDTAASQKNSLELGLKELEAEIADIDAAQAEATKIRQEEHGAFVKSSSDFKSSADATEKAIVVLREYYEGAALLQKNAWLLKGTAGKSAAHHTAGLLTRTKGKQPEFGSANSDAGSGIISVLELAAQDFTQTYTEIEAGESQAVRGFAKLTQENKVAKASKQAAVRGKASEVKSLTVALSHHQVDKDSVSKELDAVTKYLNELKPQCQTKVMSYGEKKARREAEIDGLKESLSILEGEGVSLVQKNLRNVRKH